MQKHSKPLKMKPQKRVGSEEWSAPNPRGAGGVGCGDSGTHAAWAAGTSEPTQRGLRNGWSRTSLTTTRFWDAQPLSHCPPVAQSEA